MEDDIRKSLADQRELLEKIYVSAEKTRRYFMWTLVASLALFVLPLIIFMAILPSAINTLTGV